MAGIAGWIVRGKGPGEAALAAMLEAIGHRGRDGLCGYVDRARGREVVMGASLWDEKSQVAVVIDGGITDAKALLEAYLKWDKEAVRKLRGPFAFAIWDARRERLLLGRDRFGEKPLYLYEKGGVLAFASETTALKKAFPLEVDPQAVKGALVQPYLPGTLYKGVRKLGPATQALWHFGRLVETPYWSAPDREPYNGVAVSGGVEAFAGELDDAVRLRAADAVFLSGGLDSAALVASASRNGSQLHTFTFGLAEDRNSELAAAAEVAKQFGTTHHEVVATPQDLALGLSKVIVLRDAPAARPSDVAVYVLANAAKGRKRVLTGEGCDEVLGGYRRYITARLKGNFRKELYAAQTGDLPNQALERTERIGAGASLEMQQPFLDHGLAETVSALPDDMRLRGMATKWILREAARERLPKLGPRRRGGFRVSAKDVMSKDLLMSLLGAPDARVRPYLDDPAELDRLLKEPGKKDHEKPLWTLLNLEIWLRSCASG
jgi:asparagine synthetase B (glutamine-hydrolysing)